LLRTVLAGVGIGGWKRCRSHGAKVRCDSLGAVGDGVF
jgi:hypothetical protein